MFPTTQLASRFRRWKRVCKSSSAKQSACALQRGTHLATEQARLFPVLGWTPELEVIIVGIFGVDPALLQRQRREVDVDGDSAVPRTWIVAHQDEPPAGVRRDGDDSLDAHRLIRELVLSPMEPLVRAEHNLIRGPLVVRHDEDGARVAELPEMRVLVNLLPGEAGIAAQESTTLIVGIERLANVTDSHEHARH